MIAQIEAGIIVAVSAALFSGGYYMGHHNEAAHWRAEWSARDARDAQTAATNAETILNNERQHSVAMAALDAKYQQDTASNEKHYKDLLANYRAGSIRLRSRFTCPTTSTVPTTNPASSSSNAASTGGLSQQDAEFLIRLAQQADATARQLSAAQTIILEDRQDFQKNVKNLN